MPSFDLVLRLSPAFHRPCSIRIAGDGTGSASLDAPETGLLPRCVLTVPVEPAGLATLHDLCTRMLAGRDASWNRMGLDGIGVDGTFSSAGSPPQAFSVWSPRAGHPAHAMIAAALECFPVAGGEAAQLLDTMRPYFGLQPAATGTVPPLPLSRMGEPVVLGDIPVSSDELIALARTGNRIAVVRAFRKAYPLTVAQASQAADELLKIVSDANKPRG